MKSRGKATSVAPSPTPWADGPPTDRDGAATLNLARSPEGRGDESQFQPLARSASLVDRVADALLNSVLAGQWQVGQLLPSERELSSSFQVSRTVVREAVRALAARGVVEVLNGSGTRVAQVHASTVVDSMRLYLSGRESIGFAKVHEVRTMIESHVAERAASTAAAAYVERMQSLCDLMSEALADADQFALLDVEFHRTVAASTDNELYVTMLDSIADVLIELRRRTSSTVDRRAQALADHRAIADQIRSRDPAGARQAMETHLSYTLSVGRELETPW